MINYSKKIDSSFLVEVMENLVISYSFLKNWNLAF